MRGETRGATPGLIRSLLFDLLGVAGLMLKGRYAGPWQEAVHSYGGNVAASFAVYWVLTLLFLPLRCAPTAGAGAATPPPWLLRFNRLIAAGLALLIVELFEALNGFGVMTNVYDPADFAANAAGVALALAVDIVTSAIGRGLAQRGGRSGDRSGPAG